MSFRYETDAVRFDAADREDGQTVEGVYLKTDPATGRMYAVPRKPSNGLGVRRDAVEESRIKNCLRMQFSWRPEEEKKAFEQFARLDSANARTIEQARQDNADRMKTAWKKDQGNNPYYTGAPIGTMPRSK